jgi:4,5-epoxidase
MGFLFVSHLAKGAACAFHAERGRYNEATMDPQILIVGAGPTGLALACQCLQQGLRVRILDKKPGPSDTSKAVGLQYRVSEVLACMGLADRFLARGGSPTTVNMYVKRQPILRLKFEGFSDAAGREAFEPRPIMIPQSETEQLLWEAVRERGGDVEWETEFLNFTPDAAKVTARIRRADGREEQVACDYLVSCEGAHSVARKQAGLTFAGKTYPLVFFMADVALDWSADDNATHVWFHPDGSCAAMPFRETGRWRMFVEMTNQADRYGGIVTLDTIRDLVAERTGDRETKISDPRWISEFRIHCRMVDHYRSGRVFVAGDAAHIHSPTGGQGIATGIQDAVNLAWKLGRVLKGAPDSLLDTYEEERLPKAKEVLNETNRITTVMFAPTWRKRILRDYIVLPILNLRWTQRKMFAKLAQLHVNYRESRLSMPENGVRSRVRAGDRAPDVAFRRADKGETVTLFQLLKDVRPVVLLGPVTQNEPTRYERLLDALERLDLSCHVLISPGEVYAGRQARCLIDIYGDFRRLYGMTPEFLCLIRPDDHVGLVQRGVNAAALRDYLGLLSPAEAVNASFGDGPPVASAQTHG